MRLSPPTSPSEEEVRDVVEDAAFLQDDLLKADFHLLPPSVATCRPAGADGLRALPA